MEKITFCIPSKSNLRYLKTCIPSIREYAWRKDHDIIVFVDSDKLVSLCTGTLRRRFLVCLTGWHTLASKEHGKKLGNERVTASPVRVGGGAPVWLSRQSSD